MVNLTVQLPPTGIILKLYSPTHGSDPSWIIRNIIEQKYSSFYKEFTTLTADAGQEIKNMNRAAEKHHEAQ